MYTIYIYIVNIYTCQEPFHFFRVFIDELNGNTMRTITPISSKSLIAILISAVIPIIQYCF